MSYQKKDGRGHVRPSFFWYDTDFLENMIYEVKSYFFALYSQNGLASPIFWAPSITNDNDKDLKVCFLVTRVNL